MKQFYLFIAIVALCFSAASSASGGPPIPPPPDDMLGTSPPPSPPPTATATTKKEKKKRKNTGPCAGKPGTRWCVPLKKCVSIADYKKECKAPEDGADEDAEPDCELGVVEEDGKKRCKTFDERLIEALDKLYAGGAKDKNGNCLFGPFLDKEELAAAVAENRKTTCWTYQEAQEKNDHSTLFLILFLLCLGGIGGVAYLVHYRWKKFSEAADMVKKFIENQPPAKKKSS